MTSPSTTRVLIVTDSAEVAPELLSAVSQRSAQSGSDRVRFRLVVLNPSRAEVHLLHPGRHDEVAQAELVLWDAVPRLEEAAGGRPVVASVSVRHDPMDAVEETVAGEPVHEIWLHVRERALARRLHQDLPHRLAHLHVPVRTIDHDVPAVR